MTSKTLIRTTLCLLLVLLLVLSVASCTPKEAKIQAVWITESGERYHSSPDCSNMKEPQEVNIEEATKRGYTPCQKCYE